VELYLWLRGHNHRVRNNHCLKQLQAENWLRPSKTHLLLFGAPIQVVVLSQVLASEVNIGYEDLRNLKVSRPECCQRVATIMSTRACIVVVSRTPCVICSSKHAALLALLTSTSSSKTRWRAWTVSVLRTCSSSSKKWMGVRQRGSALCWRISKPWVLFEHIFCYPPCLSVRLGFAARKS